MARLVTHQLQQVLAVWEADISTYEPVIEQDLVRQSELENEYVELLAGADLQFDGDSHNLSQIVKFRESSNRAVRRGAEMVRWRWYAEQRERLAGLPGCPASCPGEKQLY